MKTLISSPENNDESFSRSISYQLDSRHVSISACTFAGRRYSDSPLDRNEDAFSIIENSGNIIIGIFDGSSGQQPIQELGGEKGGRFASHYAKFVLETDNDSTSSVEILKSINQKLHKKIQSFSESKIFVNSTLPGSTGTIIVLNENTLSLSHLGDTFCAVLFNDGISQLLTNDLVKPFDEINYSVIRKIAQEKHISPREAKSDPEVKRSMEWTGSMRNSPDGKGKGYVNGQIEAEQYIQHVSLPLENIKAILIGTDGLVPPNMDIENTDNRDQLFKLVEDKGIEGLVKFTRQVEDGDPDWKFIRYKHSDDATGIYISF